MLSAVTSALSTVISWIGTVIAALTTAPTESAAGGALYALLPLFGVGIAVSALMLGIKVIRSMTWGA